MPAFHKVQTGECLSTIGKQYRFEDFRTIFDHPKNGQLKKKRENPNVLFPGDCLFIPDKEQKQDGRVTDQKYVHEVKASTIHLRVRVLDDELKPIASKRFELKTDRQEVFRGTTGEDGMIDQLIATDAREAHLTVALDDEDETDLYEATLSIGELAPVTELMGVQARLNNLGYFCGNNDGIMGPLTAGAVKRFQQANGLDVDGIPGPATQAKLQELHGC